MCMPMGSPRQAAPVAAAPVPVNAFNEQLTAQLNPKNPGTITRDNPLLTKGQRVKLDTANTKRTEVAAGESTGAQYLQ